MRASNLFVATTNKVSRDSNRATSVARAFRIFCRSPVSYAIRAARDERMRNGDSPITYYNGQLHRGDRSARVLLDVSER